MMKFILLTTQLFYSIPTFAQNHLIGIKGGVSWSNTYNNSTSRKGDNRTGYSVGLSYEYNLKNHIVLGTDLIYLQEGYKFHALEADILPNGFEPESNYNYDFLALPIKVGYTCGNKVSGLINIGLVPSILIYSEHTIRTPEGLYGEEFNNNKFVIASLIEVGVNIRMSNRLTFSTLLSYIINISYVNKASYVTFDFDQIYLQNLTLTGGVKYALTKVIE